MGSKLLLFGSRARGDYREDSDYDVFIIGAHPKLLEILKPYSLERGGKLDLFLFAGDCLLAAFDPDGMRRIFGKVDLRGVAEDAVEISLSQLLEWLKEAV